MSGAPVVVVPTGVANIASVRAAFTRLGMPTEVSDDPARVREADRVVLPGVGAFGAAMEVLDRGELTDPLRARLRARRPTLAVCLGLQLLCDGSEEDPDTPGLGVVPGTVRRLDGVPRVPQLGWNRVRPDGAASLLQEGWAYFAHSYRLGEGPDGWSVAWAEAGRPFVAALEDGPVLACQFHPELSGPWGQDLLSRWLRRSAPESEGTPWS